MGYGDITRFSKTQSFYLALMFFVFFMVSAGIHTSYTAEDEQVTQIAKLLADDGSADNQFGYSVSVDGNYALVGAYLGGDNGTNSGSAYIFKRNGETWTQTDKITANDGATNDYFGCSVSLNGDYALVGAYMDDDNGSDSGSAYIFKRSGETWTQTDKITPNEWGTSDTFGYSVSLNGDYALVGASRDDDNGSSSGSAYVFKRSGETWTQTDKITPNDGGTNDHFGCSVSLNGDYALVGAYMDDDNGSSSGSAYIFKRNGEIWLQTDKILSDDGTIADFFGCSVSLSGDCALVGAYADDDKGSDSGSAYIFKRSGETWTQTDKITPNDGGTNYYFGYSVSLNGDYALVGASLDDDNGTNSGSAYIFKRNGETWTQAYKLVPDDGAMGDQFGGSVSLSGDYALVGAYADDDNGSDSGSVYIFQVKEDENDAGGDSGGSGGGDGSGDCFIKALTPYHSSQF
ncbi:MAG: FG-GAP repeat protein [Desulfatibacillum sp.]|nr:FG-GAP repeat protein [Desulfatibacillum sp.]